MKLLRTVLAFVLISETIAIGFAHEGHSHADEGISLWQIVIVVGAALIAYFAVKAVLKWRDRQHSRDADPTGGQTGHNRE
jgi:threonine/homoserine/homoserine lactone efflux protein